MTDKIFKIGSYMNCKLVICYFLRFYTLYEIIII